MSSEAHARSCARRYVRRFCSQKNERQDDVHRLAINSLTRLLLNYEAWVLTRMAGEMPSFDSSPSYLKHWLRDQAEALRGRAKDIEHKNKEMQRR